MARDEWRLKYTVKFIDTTQGDSYRNLENLNCAHQSINQSVN